MKRGNGRRTDPKLCLLDTVSSESSSRTIALGNSETHNQGTLLLIPTAVKNDDYVHQWRLSNK